MTMTSLTGAHLLALSALLSPSNLRAAERRHLPRRPTRTKPQAPSLFTPMSSERMMCLRGRWSFGFMAGH